MENIYHILNIIMTTLVCATLTWGAYVLSKVTNPSHNTKKQKQCK